MGDVSDIVAANIRILRQARGWSVREMQNRCEQAGTPMSYTNISRFENRHLPTITLRTLEGVARVFDTTAAELLVPLDCQVCHGRPPEGFTCKNCGA